MDRTCVEREMGHRVVHRRPRRRRAAAWLAGALAVGLGGAIPTRADAGTPPADQRAALSLVMEDVLHGDLVLAGNSNVVRVGGSRSGTTFPADIDGDRTVICSIRQGPARPACADNSSSARLDLPHGASVHTARLYVSTSISPSARPLRVRLSGPGDELRYTVLSSSVVAPKVGEWVAGASAAQRVAAWDVTEFVRRRGGGDYAVADIVTTRAGLWQPYASWTLVVAYELGDGVSFDALTPELQVRFGRRAVSWHDGLADTGEGPVAIDVGGFSIPLDRPVFAKTFHVLAHPGPRGFENLLFAGGPVGNNVTPGDAPPPVGVVLGTDPTCNSTVNVANDSICLLGTPVVSRLPGPIDPRSSADGNAPTSGSGVDMDVMRIADGYLQPGAQSAVISVVAGDDVAVAVLAASIDQPAPVQETTS
jgi:hypothetical protein